MNGLSNAAHIADEMERTLGRDPFAKPAAGSLALHGALACCIVFWGLLNGLFHHNTWGGTQGGGAIQVQITASIPLPQQQVNDNVLTTENPSQAAAELEPKKLQTIDKQAIPIPGKQTKPKQQPLPKTNPHAPPPKPDARVHYGEQAGTQMPRALPPSSNNGPATVSDGDFGSRFPWYVDGILRKMQGAWNRAEVDGNTPRGARVYVQWTLHRDGAPTQVEVQTSSGNASLDRSCVRAAQRVDSFGQLPAAYNQSTLKVSYYCEY